MAYINKIGVELEGGWKRLPRDKAIQRDLSVRNLDLAHQGELASPPLSLDELEKWILSHYPDGINSTCGFHVHVSLKSPWDYHRLTSKKFYNTLLKKIRLWGLEEKIPEDHHFWKRLAGTFTSPNGRNFCRKEFLPELQIYNNIKGEDGTARHCHLNFCWTMHGTVELRLFPMFADATQAVRAAKLFVDIVEKFISKEHRLKGKKKLRISLDPRPEKRPRPKPAILGSWEFI